MSASRFSDNNSPVIVFDTDLLYPPEPENSEPARPQKLKRQTNEWMYYFGEYPSACAFISTEAEVRSDIGKTALFVTRHVLNLKIDSDSLKQKASNTQVAMVQCDVRDKVNFIYLQLDTFADSGLITVKRSAGGAEINYQGESIFLVFKVCDDSGNFHVLIMKKSRWMGQLTYPDMENVTSLIYCLRMIFINTGLFTTFEFEVAHEDWARTSGITLELSLETPEE
jgi:hypothetical protein